MTNTVDRWRNMTKAEIAATDVGTLWNTIDEFCDHIEQLRAIITALDIRITSDRTGLIVGAIDNYMSIHPVDGPLKEWIDRWEADRD